MAKQPSPEMIDHIRDIPIYRNSIANNFFPILEKPTIAQDFPNNWMTSRLVDALKEGKAEFVLSTGTNHARMHIIRPPYFLLHSYYKLWSTHPDIAFTWGKNCQRVSITTVLATEHVRRMNAKKQGVDVLALNNTDSRRLDARTLYLNQTLDPDLWTCNEVECMLDEIAALQQEHPEGLYHLDCSAYHLAHFVRKVQEWGLHSRFPEPASIIHAYEYTPHNVRQFLLNAFSCPLIDLFGSTELGYIYYNDKNNRYTPYLESMHLELVPLTTESKIYSLIISSIRNPYMPLIRYRSGDCVLTSDGSSDPEKIVRFCGREKEMLETPKGSISQAHADEIIAETSADIFIYQLCVRNSECAELRYTTFDGVPIDEHFQEMLQVSLTGLIGRTCIVTHRKHIPIGKSGKYMWLLKGDTVSHVPAPDKQELNI